MKRILDFCQQNKYAIIWTACYAVIMWSILFWLFNFNMFSATQWRILAHAELRGFPGFVFGILILAAVPMYIATTSIVVRTKKPLFKIPLPKFMTPVPIDAPTTAPAPASSATDAPPPAPDTTPSTPAKTIPAEVRAAFTRAREHGAIFQKSAFDPSNADAPTAHHTPDAIPELQPAGSHHDPVNGRKTSIFIIELYVTLCGGGKKAKCQTCGQQKGSPGQKPAPPMNPEGR